MFSGIDQRWTLKADDVPIEASLNGMLAAEVTIDVAKTLVMAGTTLSDMTASDLNVIAATEYTITATTKLTFHSDSLFTVVMPSSMMEVYAQGTYIGVIRLVNVTIFPGINTVSKSVKLGNFYSNF